MIRIPKIRVVVTVTTILAGILLPACLVAQDYDDDAPLGDVARNLRKKEASSQEIIDNDNLSKVTDDVANHRVSGSALLYSFDKVAKNFQVSAPDVTCSLSFSANARALLSSQYVQADLPPNEVLKLEGPATINGSTLQISMFNGTDWHVSELAVALTVVKRVGVPEISAYYSPAKLVAAVADEPAPPAGGQMERKSDVTMLYHMRAAAPPSETAIFSTPLNMDVAPDQEWHWAIVQAKGYPPQHTADQSAQSAQPPSAQPVTEPASLPVPDAPQSSTPGQLQSNPHPPSLDQPLR